VGKQGRPGEAGKLGRQVEAAKLVVGLPRERRSKRVRASMNTMMRRKKRRKKRKVPILKKDKVEPASR